MVSINRIIILSDMFGEIDENMNYMDTTAQFFKAMNYKVDVFSSVELGGIKNLSNTDKLHQLFIDNGIKCAANKLSNILVQYDIGIGFSIGGLILWEACKINSCLLRNLVCISSTRLRYEITKLKSVNTTLIYGENDSNSPQLFTIKKLSDHFSIISNSDHDLYKQQDLLKDILNNLKIH